MDTAQLAEQSQFIYNDLRLKTFPVGVKFLEEKDALPEKSRRPAQFLKKKITTCQAMTMARTYGWQMGITSEDLICPLSALALGLTGSPDPEKDMADAFFTSNYKSSVEKTASEVGQMCFLDNGRYEALLISPLHKIPLEPDTVVLYGNPGQISRLVQAATFDTEEKIKGIFGGKVECPEYLIRPMVSERPRVVLPGPGDRIFSMTADDEMILALPLAFLDPLIRGLKEAGKKIGARYPITFYQNFQPEFPTHYQELAAKLGLQ